MKLTSLLVSAAIAVTGLSAPTMTIAAVDLSFDPLSVQIDTGHGVAKDDGTFETAQRGRGRGGDDDRGGRDRGRGSDDRGTDDRGGRDRDRGSDDRGTDDRGGRDRDRGDDNASGRDRPRIPGGSGCDDAGDVLEHASCRP